MKEVDDLSLNAYLDGELDSEACAHIERALEVDPDLRERLRSLREVDAMLSGALKHALLGPSVSDTSIVATLAPKRVDKQTPLWRAWPAMAASIAALAFGAAIGYQFSASPTGKVSEFETTFAKTLESTPSGVQVAWSSPDAGAAGTVVAVRTWQAKNGQYCREYEAQRTQAQRRESETGVACRRPDGTWRVRMRYYD